MSARAKKFLWMVALILFLGALFLLSLAMRQPEGFSSDIAWGVAFSRPWSESLGLDWRKTYTAILDDLRPKSLRLPVYWPDVEVESGKYIWSDYDWMIYEAERRGTELVLVMGRKVPRWPECHAPEWAKVLDEKAQQEKILVLLSEIVKRYKDKTNIYAWQVENEPFLPFGECPGPDVSFLQKEIDLVRSLDVSRPVMVTDSGEFGSWFRAAKRADIFGTTMYRIVWSPWLGYVKYPLPPKFFWLKANLVRLFYPHKPIIVSELQAEPWAHKRVYDISWEEQSKSLNLRQFRDNINYARAAGFPKVYLWGAEWWYWLKVKYNHPEFWEEARQLFRG
ncbi:MAG: hypothetical protein HZC14_01825 [Candidatus Niyogibacteria bacterium]|nr:hypothetical protein [Candidatus Niyogibacteria bacterium]